MEHNSFSAASNYYFKSNKNQLNATLCRFYFCTVTLHTMMHGNTKLKFSYYFLRYTGRFTMLSVITNIYNKTTKGPTSMELFTATGKLKKFVSDN